MKHLDKPNWRKQNERKKYGRLIWLGVILCLPLVIGAVFVYKNAASENPSVFTSELEFSGNQIIVKAGGDFQSALDRAKPGDTIVLQAGAAFTGSFNLPNKNGGDFITIRTSAIDAQLPPSDTRIDPIKYAAVFPKLSSPTTEPVILAKDGAHHYRFIGIEFGGTKGGFYNIIQLGTTEEKSTADLPHHIEFDRVYIHSTATEGQRRGIAANGKYIKIVNSYISDIKRKGEESQAIAVWGTDGPIEIVNNYLEAAAQSILFGGATSALELTPTDCLVRSNHLNKPLKWREEGWAVKNIFEIKDGKRIKVEYNLMTNNWTNAQDGSGVLFTVRTDSGQEATIEDVEFSNNIVRGSGNAVNILGYEGKGGRRLTIRNNIFADINGKKWDSSGFFLKTTGWDNLIVENNTVINSGNITNAYGEPVINLIFRNNIVFENEYGFKGDGTNPGKTTLTKYFPGGDVSDNAIIGANDSLYFGKNLYPNSINQIGFVNADAGDYRLRADSPLREKGFGGKTIGADLDPKTVGGK